MSLVSTLSKVAIGIMVAKGVGKMIGGKSSGGGLGGLLGGLKSGGANRQAGDSIDMDNLSDLGDLLGRGGEKQGGNDASLGGLLNSFGDKNATASGRFGDLFNDALRGNPPKQVSQNEEQTAALMLRAMISAAKSDGDLDEAEQQKLAKHLKDVTPEEAEFVRRELQAPMDVQGLINDVPRGMENQVYLMSLLAIDLDSKQEALYLDKLAKGMGISQQVCNQIHAKTGAPTLYT